MKQKVVSVFRIPVLRDLGILPFLMGGLAITFSIMNPQFATIGNAGNIIHQSSFLTLLALGQLFALLVGGLDISIGVLIPFVSVISALTMTNVGLPPLAAVSLGVFVGGAAAFGVGMANGAVIAFTGV